MSQTPTVIIGLDGATFDIIDPLVAQGRLPNITKLMGRGSKATLVSSEPPLSSIAWTSITTGVNPGRHGIFDFAHRKEGSYEFVPYVALDKKAPSLWRTLGDGGKKVCVVNVPLTYPPEKVNGVMLSGFPTPSGSEDWAYPASILEDLKKNVPNFSFQKPAALMGKGKEELLLDELVKKTESQVEVLSYLLKTPYDFVMTVFDITDVACHSFWKFIDKGHPKYDPQEAKGKEDLLYRCYEAADRAVGRVLDLFDSAPDTILLSDHGSGPVYYGVYINNWLVDKGYMHFKRGMKTRAKRWAFNRGFNTYNMFKLATRLGILPGIEAAYAKKSRILDFVKSISLSFNDVDWSATKVYSFGNYGQLFVNVHGREPLGIVEPGEEYGELLDRLALEIRGIEDPANRAKIFDMVRPSEDLYHGPYALEGPDLVFFDSRMLYNAHRLFELGTNRLVSPHPVYSGNHKLDGILVAAGPSFEGSTVESRVNLVSVAPTVFSLQGVSPPYGMDGEPFARLSKIPQGVVATAPPTEQTEQAAADKVFSQSESDALAERLRDLGYI